MRYIVSEHPQGTPEWLQARAGKATGSRAKDILATIKSGEAAARRDYRIELAIERLTGQAAEQGFISKDMQRGTDLEPYARMAFEEKTGLLVAESGFVYLPNIMAGCSVDGFITDGKRKGIWESKSPKTFTHIQYIKDGAVPADYMPQILHNMYVTGAEFADFFSYDDRLPAQLQCFHVRYERNESEIKDYESKLLQFLAEVDKECDELMRIVA